jgi:hypothetical protein
MARTSTTTQISKYTQNNQVIPYNERAVLGVIKIADIYKNEEHPHRRLNEGRAEMIAENYDPLKLGCLNVFFHPNSEGIFSVGNGCHRFEACKQRKIEWVPATIAYNLSFEEESDVVNGLNKQKGFTTRENFHAQIKSGDDFAQAVFDVAVNNGFQVSFGNKTRKEMEETNSNILNSPGCLVKIANLDPTLGTLSRTLNMIARCCRVEGSRRRVVDRPALNAAFIEGLAAAIHGCDNDKSKLKQIETVLLENSAGDILIKGASTFNKSQAGYNRSRAITKQIYRVGKIKPTRTTLVE